MIFCQPHVDMMDCPKDTSKDTIIELYESDHDFGVDDG